MNRKQLFSFGILTLITYQAACAEEAALPELLVTAKKLPPFPENSTLNNSDLLRLRTRTSDTARLLEDQPGVSLYGAGGVSSLPVIHGMADDRVRTQVDGMDLISSCPNHMNSALSYLDPSNVGSVKVFAGITPVSVGGDSIGGTIQVDSAAPVFANAGEDTLFKGQAGAFYRSNNAARAAISRPPSRAKIYPCTIRVLQYAPIITWRVALSMRQASRLRHCRQDFLARI